MSDDLLSIINEEKEQNPNPPEPEHKGNYSTPTGSELNQQGGLQPISVKEQASLQTGGGTDWRGELKAWRALPQGDERVLDRDNWSQKYLGMSYDEYAGKNFIEQGMLRSNRLDQANWLNPKTAANQALMGVANFGMDVIGHIPGGAKLDDWWDEHTRAKDPIVQAT